MPQDVLCTYSMNENKEKISLNSDNSLNMHRNSPVQRGLIQDIAHPLWIKVTESEERFL